MNKYLKAFIIIFITMVIFFGAPFFIMRAMVKDAEVAKSIGPVWTKTYSKLIRSFGEANWYSKQFYSYLDKLCFENPSRCYGEKENCRDNPETCKTSEGNKP